MAHGESGDRLAQLLQVEMGIVTAGADPLCCSRLRAARGTDPEKISRLPNLQG